jgi:hypothetical protein
MKLPKGIRKTVAATPPRNDAATATKRPVTTIEAKVDVGFGNNLFVRGEGAGLSWEHGLPLKCIDPQTWQLSVPASDRLKFKLLLNDTIWAKGEDLVAAPGQRLQVAPAF